MHKYDCHNLSDLARRHAGELRPVLSATPSLSGGAEPLKSAEVGAGGPDDVKQDECTAAGLVGYTRDVLQMFRVRSIMSHMRVDGMDMSRLTMDGASQYKIPLESMYYTSEDHNWEQMSSAVEFAEDGLAQAEADDPVIMIEEDELDCKPAPAAPLDDRCLEGSQMLLSLDRLVERAERVEAERRARQLQRVESGAEDVAPAAKKRKQSSGGSRELCGLMHDVAVPKAWDQPVVEGQEELNAHLHNMLKELKGPQCASFAWPFLSKVKKAEAPDYYDLIKSPMDISTMEKRLKKCEYFSKSQFATDIALMVSNCRTYNINADSIYRTHAAQLESFAEEMLAKCPDMALPAGGQGGNGVTEDVCDARPILKRMIHATKVQSEEARQHTATTALRERIDQLQESQAGLEFGERSAIVRSAEEMGSFLDPKHPPKWPELTHPASCVPTAWRLPEPSADRTAEWAAKQGSRHLAAAPRARCMLQRGIGSLLTAEGFTSVQAGVLPLLADALSTKLMAALAELQGKTEAADELSPGCVLRTLEHAGLPGNDAARMLLSRAQPGNLGNKWAEDELVASGNTTHPTKKNARGF